MSCPSQCDQNTLKGHLMANSLFLAARRAMDDFAINQRIQAAVAFHAQTFLNKPDSAEKYYAIAALLNPQSLDATMMALVLVDESIASKVVVAEDGERVDTSGVPDETILARVAASWPLVSAKYTRNPLAS